MVHNHPPEAITREFELSLKADDTYSDQTLDAVATAVDGIYSLFLTILDETVVADLTNEFFEMFGNRYFYRFQDLLDQMNIFMRVLDL